MQGIELFHNLFKRSWIVVFTWKRHNNFYINRGLKNRHNYEKEGKFELSSIPSLIEFGLGRTWSKVVARSGADQVAA